MILQRVNLQSKTTTTQCAKGVCKDVRHQCADTPLVLPSHRAGQPRGSQGWCEQVGGVNQKRRKVSPFHFTCTLVSILVSTFSSTLVSTLRALGVQKKRPDKNATFYCYDPFPATVHLGYTLGALSFPRSIPATNVNPISYHRALCVLASLGLARSDLHPVAVATLHQLEVLPRGMLRVLGDGAIWSVAVLLVRLALALDLRADGPQHRGDLVGG